MKKTVLLVCLTLASGLVMAQFNPVKNSSGYLPGAGEFPVNPELVQITAPFGQSHPSIAFAGNVYLVVWQDSRNQDGDIYGARVDRYGNLLDPTGIIICDEPGFHTSPAVATNGDFFLVVWRDNRNNESSDDIYGARVSFGGEVLDPGGFPICKAELDQDYPAVASAGTGFCVVWTDHRPGTHWDIYANLVSAEGAISHPNGFPLCTLPESQSYPGICSDGSRYFIVWEDLRNADDDIYGTFVGTNGTVSHPQGTAIAALPNDQNHPAVWSGGGQVLDPGGFVIYQGNWSQTKPAIASDGQRWMVVWEDGRSSSH